MMPKGRLPPCRCGGRSRQVAPHVFLLWHEPSRTPVDHPTPFTTRWDVPSSASPSAPRRSACVETLCWGLFPHLNRAKGSMVTDDAPQAAENQPYKRPCVM